MISTTRGLEDQPDVRENDMNGPDHIDMPGAREMDAIIALLEEGKAEEALDALDALQTAHPLLTTGLLAFRAAILSHLERYEEALFCYDRLLDRQRPRSIYEGTIPSSGYIDAHLQKAAILLRLGRYEEALAEYIAAQRLSH